MMQSRVTFTTKGRTGNNLFQYCAARLFADKHYFNFPETVTSLWPFTTTNHADPVQPCITLTDLDPVMDLQAAPGVNYHLDGWFQRNAWYFPHRDTIRSWFKHLLPDVACITDDIVMHLRLNDYRYCWADHSRIINPSWYLECLAQEKYNLAHIVMDEVDHAYLSAFKQLHAIYCCTPEDPAADFHYLRRFTRMVMSNSTFSWWAWFLGHGETAYQFPKWVDDPQIELAGWPGSFITVDGKFQER